MRCWSPRCKRWKSFPQLPTGVMRRSTGWWTRSGIPTAPRGKPCPYTTLSRAVLTHQAATLVKSLMRSATTQGVSTGAQTAASEPIIGHAATAYTGPEATPIQWFIGMIELGEGQSVVIVVVIEDAASPAESHPDRRAGVTARRRTLCAASGDRRGRIHNAPAIRNGITGASQVQVIRSLSAAANRLCHMPTQRGKAFRCRRIPA
jgi:hypothetical protein